MHAAERGEILDVWRVWSCGLSVLIRVESSSFFLRLYWSLSAGTPQDSIMKDGMANNSTASISQARKAVEQLKMEACMDRIKVSKAAADLMAYCDAHIREDPLIVPVPASENPFREKKFFCTILWGRTRLQVLPWDSVSLTALFERQSLLLMDPIPPEDLWGVLGGESSVGAFHVMLNRFVIASSLEISLTSHRLWDERVLCFVSLRFISRATEVVESPMGSHFVFRHFYKLTTLPVKDLHAWPSFSWFKCLYKLSWMRFDVWMRGCDSYNV